MLFLFLRHTLQCPNMYKEKCCGTKFGHRLSANIRLIVESLITLTLPQCWQTICTEDSLACTNSYCVARTPNSLSNFCTKCASSNNKSVLYIVALLMVISVSALLNSSIEKCCNMHTVFNIANRSGVCRKWCSSR